jgi:hypothetical protein
VHGWAISPYDAAIWKEDRGQIAFVHRTKFEKPFDPTKTTGALAAAEFPMSIPDRKEAIAFDTARIHIERLALLPSHRFHRVAPEPDDSSACAAHIVWSGSTT